MNKPSKWRIISFLLCTILALWLAAPNFYQEKSKFLPENKINLGLDLKGGAHLLLDIDFKAYQTEVMQILTDGLRKKFKERKIGYKNLVSTVASIKFEAREDQNIDKIKQAIYEVDSRLEFNHQQNKINLEYSEQSLHEIKNQVINQSIEIVRLRVDSTGTTEPVIQRQGEQYILLQVPGIQDPEHIKNLLGKTAKLTFHLVDEQANIEEYSKGKLSIDSRLVYTENVGENKQFVAIKKKIILSGDQLTTAQATFDQNSQPAVSFSLNNIGSKIFAETTKDNPGKRLAIVLDNKLLCAPSINKPILEGSGIISGNFTVDTANDLALMLRAGALPAPLKIVEERSIGPNLGADSIAAGKKAGLIGFIGVVAFMIWSYGIFGLFANIALVAALLYIMALLTLFQATLTLPGIAGIILTIGMAVDANVLIYERIKEEINNGYSNNYAIKQGFDTAFATIADSNITTLIAASILYIFGVGAIKGFAVTLSIGIISSMFAAIVVTKLLIDLWMKYRNPKDLGLIKASTK